MKLSFAFPAVVFAITLTQCEKAVPPPEPGAAPKNTVKARDEAQMKEWRDALARQAVEFDARSALMDQQLADLEKKLQMQENEALRGQLNGLKQQNDALRSQADAARRQSEAITQSLAVTTHSVATATTPKDYSLFYERLAPHGRWLDVSGYGLCFQPRMARTRIWRPYLDGCWAWTSLGWAWQSNEPFGWATYHYGRWIELSHHGWVWVPGSEWAPAWVAWRQGRDHVGWAPLPPERGVCGDVQRDCDSRYGLGPASYTFISTTNFIQPSYTAICHPVSYNTTIFRHTVNVTQIVPCGGSSHTPMYMHHGGPPRHHIEETCRRPVPQPQIRKMAASMITLKPANAEAISVVELPAAPTKPNLADLPVAERITRPQLADSFAGVPQTVRTEIQQVIVEDKNRTVSATSPAAPALRTSPSIALPNLETPQPAVVLNVATPEPLPPQPGLAPIETTASLPSAPPPAVTMASSVAPAMPVLATVAETASLTNADTSPLTPQSAPVIAAASLESTPALPVVAELAPAAPVVPVTNAVEPNAAIPRQAEAAVMAQKQAEEPARVAVEQEAQRQQAESARQQAESAAMAQKQAADEAARAAAEQEAQRQQAEAAAMAQKQAEEAQRRAAEEQMRQAQAEAQRQAEEAARRAQEEQMRRAQEEAIRQAQDAARRAQEEAMRRAQEEAQRQAEEAARRAAEEAARRAQEEAARQAAEAAQRAVEEAARRAQEEAARPMPPQ